MKRILLRFLALVVAISGLFSLTGLPVVAQNVNNFTISHFEADYYLSQDTEDRSQLKTVEKITAEFPNYDQNHGLERALPEKYDGHSTSLKVESVTDESGQTLPYSDYTSNDNLVLRIGDADTYMHGKQTYVITYTQRDVTRYFADTNDDEFYWDVNGTQWRVPVQKTTARVHVASPLSDNLNGQSSCYEGQSGSTMQCALRQEPGSGGGVMFTADAVNMGHGQTMTFAIGFQPQTFTGYQPSWQEILLSIWPFVVLATVPIALIVIIWLSIKYSRIIHRKKGRQTIVAEYLPPKNTSVLVAGQVLKNNQADITAQLIDLAVRHYLKIYQTKEKTLFRQPEYELEIIKHLDDLQKEEQGLLKDLFHSSPKPGDRFKMKELQKSYALRKSLFERRKSVHQLTRGKYGIFERAVDDVRWFNRAGVVILIVGILTLSPPLLIIAIIVFIMAQYLWPYTEKGAELKDYLEGLKLYITVAEKERLKMLQSPEGAEKVGKIEDDNTKQLVKLYERVLPYAVLFGVEKEWAKQLGVYYETSQTQPDWYIGHGAFNAAVFSSAVGGFSSASSSYSSASSASTGGSGGGGSAGGGGGGGGGGGW